MKLSHVAAIFVALAVFGAIALYSISLGSNNDVQAGVISALEEHPEIDASLFEVSESDGVVTFRGKIDDESMRKLVIEQVNTVPGVERVVDEMTLSSTEVNDPAHEGVEKIATTLAEMDVEHHWLAGKHVDWLTGDPDGLPVSATGYHTHCSAFVAAACKRLGIPILEPPQHPQELLADAQYDWLESDVGREAGWSELKGALQANEFAGQGKLVIAVYKNPDTAEPGHIAIVIPSKHSVEELEKDGPDITQAGRENFARTTVRIGFKNHPEAWETSRQLRFFGHVLH